MATEMKLSATAVDRIEELLGGEARSLLDHKSQAIPQEQLHLPGPISSIEWWHSQIGRVSLAIAASVD